MPTLKYPPNFNSLNFTTRRLWSTRQGSKYRTVGLCSRGPLRCVSPHLPIIQDEIGLFSCYGLHVTPFTEMMRQIWGTMH